MTGNEPRRGQNAVSRLGRLLGLPPLPADVAEELAALRGEVGRLTQANADWQASQAQSQAQLTAALEALERLEKQTARAGKEQFKANALAEAQQQHLKALLEQAGEAERLRAREIAELLGALKTAKAEGRLEMLLSLLPAMDGLSEALAAGERLLNRQAGPNEPAANLALGRPLPLATRLVGAWDLLTRPAGLAGQAAPGPAMPREALVAWLRGVALVRDRLLDQLAAEDIHLIETVGEHFDPQQHVAVDTVPAGDGLPPGVIAEEIRRGYRQGAAVLRYAEVVVAK